MTSCKIIFLQPGYAHYRNKLFKTLTDRHKIKLIYERSFNVYPGEIKANNLDCIFLRSGRINKWINLLNILLSENPDIVITSISSSFRTILSYFYCKAFNKKFVLWILEWKQPTYKGKNIRHVVGRLRNKLSKIIIKDCHALIVGGTASYKYAVLLGKSRNDIFYAIQCADDLANERRNETIRDRSNKNKFTFLYLSRIIKWKGLDILLNAFSKLEKEYDDIFLIVGGDGGYRKYCIELSNKLGIRNIDFRGAIQPNDLQNIYKEADAFILPSYFLGNSYEAWGLVINEAMSMSLPIITTTAVGAAYDLIEEGKNGYIINENNIDDLYKAMNRLIHADVKKMGQISRQIFEVKNNFNNMADGFSDAINYVIKL